MQQQSTFNFGLTKIFFLIYRTLSMRQKTKNDRNQGSNAKKTFFLVLCSSPLPRWVRLVQKTRAKHSHAWAPLKVIEGIILNFIFHLRHLWYINRIQLQIKLSIRIQKGDTHLLYPHFWLPQQFQITLYLYST
jgi:hypothetical protein